MESRHGVRSFGRDMVLIGWRGAGSEECVGGSAVFKGNSTWIADIVDCLSCLAQISHVPPFLRVAHDGSSTRLIDQSRVHVLTPATSLDV